MRALTYCAALLAGCAAPDARATPDACMATAQLGTGTGGSLGGFRAVDDGVYLVPGPQGGQHVWVALRARGLDVTATTTELRAFHPDDGATLATLRLRRALSPLLDAPGWYGLATQPLVLPDDVYCAALHQPLGLSATVTDTHGCSARVTVRTRLIDVDPSAAASDRASRLACCSDPTSRCHPTDITDAGTGAPDASGTPATVAALTAWRALQPPIGGTASASAVWTGREVLVWGGVDDTLRDLGAAFDPRADAWRTLSREGAPTPRAFHSAVWTGAEMIVWGGAWRGHQSDGARYDPVTDRWRPLPDAGRPAPRAFHRAVWTGTEMIITGEYLMGSLGGRYRPDTDAWSPLPMDGAPTGRESHSAIWTGTEMIVWGGVSSTFELDDGARFDPRTDTWRRLSSTGAPSGRVAHVTVWTGTEMIVWGGWNGTSALGDGAAYDPARDTWRALSSVGAPSPRTGATAVWTGAEMVVWGGFDGASARGDGARYDPVTDRWAPLPDALAPNARWDHTAVWTGAAMTVWGGFVGDGPLAPPAAALGAR